MIQTKLSKNYTQPKAGKTERFIEVKPFKVVSSHSALLELKNYTIVNTGEGIKSVEKILKQVLLKKLKIKYRQDFSLKWHEYMLLKVECEIFDKRRRYFDEFKPQSLKDIHINYIESEERLNLILKYKENSPDQIPLYFSSESFKKGTKDTNNTNEIYMIDGSKRIAASALRHERVIEIYLIIHESEYKNFLPRNSDDIEKLQKSIKEIPWFPSYQELTWFGISGRRDSDRFQLIFNYDKNLFINRTAIDFGCNLGQTCFKTVQSGIKQIYGIDVVTETLEVAKKLKNLLKMNNVNFLQIDFNDVNFSDKINSEIPEVDFCFFLSVYRTKELTQRDTLLDYIYSKCKLGVIFEGHGAKIDTRKYYEKIFNKRGWRYDYLGLAESGKYRPLYFIRKQI